MHATALGGLFVELIMLKYKLKKTQCDAVISVRAFNRSLDFLLAGSEQEVTKGFSSF